MFGGHRLQSGPVPAYVISGIACGRVAVTVRPVVARAQADNDCLVLPILPVPVIEQQVHSANRATHKE